jgi:hypothetical protein
VCQWTAGATIVGVVPSFDADCLAATFARHGVKPGWNDELVDVVPLATAAVRAVRPSAGTDLRGAVQAMRGQAADRSPAPHGVGRRPLAIRWYDRLREMRPLGQPDA